MDRLGGRRVSGFASKKRPFQPIDMPKTRVTRAFSPGSGLGVAFAGLG
jgi:hypothetical protein